MDQTSSHSCSLSACSKHVVSIARSDRWQVYHRLQELNITCACLPDGKLQVEISSPSTAVQVWSVLQQLTRSRKQLSHWLERCWELSAS